MTKKITAVILSALMAFSLMSVAVSAAEAEIIPYTPVSVTASSVNNPVLKFVPAETKEYILTSYAPDDIDPYCTVDSLNDSLYIDDSSSSVNFAEKLVFEAGVEYYITVATYSDEDATFDIALACDHEWDEDTCVDCGKVCDHDAKNTRFKTCECGKVSLTTLIELGTTEDVAFNGVKPIVRKFVPEEDVAAVIYSDVFINGIMYDAYVSVFNASGDVLAENDDFGESMNFVLLYEFKAGETYFIEIGTYYEGLSFSFSFVKAAHTADDGTEHDVIYTEYQEGTCQEPCYTEGIYCAECDIYFAGHIEDGYGICMDNDGDDECDYCGDNDVVEDIGDEAADGEEGIIRKIIELVNYLRSMVLKIFAFFIYR